MASLPPAFLCASPLPTRACRNPSLRVSRVPPPLAPPTRVARPCRITPRLTVVQPTSPSSPASASSPSETDVLIIGGGVSGTSLAFHLHKHHPDVSALLTEARDVIGGNVISRSANGYIWEEGPNSFQPAPHILRLAVDVGLKNDLVLADHTLPRFVYWDDNLFALPMSPSDIPKFRLLSPWGAIRAGLGAMGFVMPGPGREESVKDFISRHLGVEVFQKMIDPFVSGVYAGDPAKLCMSAAFKKIFALQELGMTLGIVEGAIIRINQKKKEAPPPDPELPTYKGGALGSFRLGLGMLPKAIAARLGDAVRVSWELVGLTRMQDGRYQATYNTPEGQRIVIAKTVAVTAPARGAAKVLQDIAPGTAALEKITYPTVWSVTLAYPKSEFKEPLRGFGNLIPRSLGIRTLGTIWSSVLFPGRAPDDMDLLLSYIGGAQDDGIKELSQEEVVATVDKDIKKILMKKGSEVKPVVVGARRWERAIPQYNLGYWDLMGEAEESLKSCPGIYLGGNYTSGVAFGDCVLWGTETAPKIAEYVESFVPSNSE